MSSTINLRASLTSNLPGFNFQFNHPLAPLTYFKIGGPAEAYIKLSNREKIIKLVKFCQSEKIKLTILGGASNVVIADEGIKGLVLHLAHDQISFTNQSKSSDKKIVVAETGIKTATLVRKTIDNGLTGLEYFLGVPGTLGGAVYNNSHYLSDLISEYISRVEIINPSGMAQWLDNSECDFEYDQSRFQQTKEVILTVEFALPLGNKDKSMEKIKEATVYRATTQPLGVPSSGCVFRNTPATPELIKLFPQFSQKSHISCGFLIDQAGLKNKTIGGVKISPKHAAFFVNTGTGTSRDFKELVKIVKAEIKEKFGVQLKEEIFYLS